MQAGASWIIGARVRRGREKTENMQKTGRATLPRKEKQYGDLGLAKRQPCMGEGPRTWEELWALIAGTFGSSLSCCWVTRGRPKLDCIGP